MPTVKDEGIAGQARNDAQEEVERSHCGLDPCHCGLDPQPLERRT